MAQLQKTIAEVKTGSAQQQGAVQQFAAEIQRAADAVENVARSARQMATTAQQAAGIAVSGGQAVEATLSSMNRIRAQVQNSSEKVMELGKKGQAIEGIIETIDQIAEQTNLLALNRLPA